MDKLEVWEKAPVIGLFAAQGLYVWQWYTHFDPHAWIVMAAGVAAVAAIDGAMVATVAGMRAGRRSKASVAAIVVTALFGALVALDLYGAVGGISAWLHAGFALTIVCYLLHLAAPRGVSRDALTQAQVLATQAASDAAQWRDALTQAEAALTQHAETAAQAQAERDALASQVDAAVRRLTQTEAALTRAQAERDAAAARADAVAMEIGGKAVSLRRAADALGINETTLRRKLTQAAADVAQAAD
jgi:uncharacterized membrane protein